MIKDRLHRIVLRWYAKNGRDLPWRRGHDPYAILVSEVMLQQTQVARVIPKYRAFLRRFPTFRSLARARLRDVLGLWSGLGYNRRAKQLWESARAIVARHNGRMPSDLDAMRALPGIGRYTAGALASFAFGQREPAVDTNVRRVLSRAVLGRDRVPDKEAWAVALDALPRDAATWNHALMDIGALYCRATPNCAHCPLRSVCVFRARGTGVDRARPAKTGVYEGSRRQHRGRAIRALTAAPSLSLLQLGPKVKEGFGRGDLPWLLDLLGDLESEGLVALNERKTRAAIA